MNPKYASLVSSTFLWRSSDLSAKSLLTSLEDTRESDICSWRVALITTPPLKGKQPKADPAAKATVEGIIFCEQRPAGAARARSTRALRASSTHGKQPCLKRA